MLISSAVQTDGAGRTAYAKHCAIGQTMDPAYNLQSCACIYDGVARIAESDELTYWVGKTATGVVSTETLSALEACKPAGWTEAALGKVAPRLPAVMKSCGFKLSE